MLHDARLQRICGLLLFLAVALGSCGSSKTAVDLTVTYVDDGLAISQLNIIAAPAAENSDAKEQVWPETPSEVSSGARVLLWLSDDWDGEQVQVTVHGVVAGVNEATGQGTVTVARGQTHVLAIVLVARCPDRCPVGEAECFGDAVRACQVNADDCPTWGPPVACPSDARFCSNGMCSNTCTDECAADAERCVSNSSRLICGNYDSDDCLEWGQPVDCQADEQCDAGQCKKLCDGELCACQPGDTDPCEDVGVCVDGVRPCVNGTFGGCQYPGGGPSSEVCNGEDDNCNGVPDDHPLDAKACEKQKGVCAGAVTTDCDGANGWVTPCTTNDYRAHSEHYDPTKDVCDGRNNDCDSQTDENANCGANRICTEGNCVCRYGALCGGSCCGQTEVCYKNSCCQPDPCGDKQCGDAGCGVSCGAGCTAPTTCNDSGYCEYPVVLVSRTNSATPAAGNGHSNWASPSDDGTIIAFHSRATGFSGDDNSSGRDIYVHEVATCTTTLASVSSKAGSPIPDDESYEPHTSGDGCYVGYLSDATNLVDGDTEGHRDAFVYQRCAGGTTVRMSVASDGTEANAPTDSVIVGPGGVTFFISGASNLVTGRGLMPGGSKNVFVHNSGSASARKTRLVSRSTTGGYANGQALSLAMNSSPRFITFSTPATNLVSPATSGTHKHVYVAETLNIFVDDTVIIDLASKTEAGVEGDGDSLLPAVTQTGDVTFETTATNLVSAAGTSKVVFYDGSGPSLIAGRDSYRPTVSRLGRFIVFDSEYDGFVPNDEGLRDVFIVDRDAAAEGTTPAIYRLSVNADGTRALGESRRAVISGDGKYIVFETIARLVPGDTNNYWDIYLVPNPFLDLDFNMPACAVSVE